MLFPSLIHPPQAPILHVYAAMLSPLLGKNGPLLMEPSLLELELSLAIEPYQACNDLFPHPIYPYACPIELWSPFPPITSFNGKLVTHTHTHSLSLGLKGPLPLAIGHPWPKNHAPKLHFLVAMLSPLHSQKCAFLGCAPLA